MAPNVAAHGTVVVGVPRGGGGGEARGGSAGAGARIRRKEHEIKEALDGVPRAGGARGNVDTGIGKGVHCERSRFGIEARGAARQQVPQRPDAEPRRPGAARARQRDELLQGVQRARVVQHLSARAKRRERVENVERRRGQLLVLGEQKDEQVLSKGKENKRSDSDWSLHKHNGL